MHINIVLLIQILYHSDIIIEKCLGHDPVQKLESKSDFRTFYNVNLYEDILHSRLLGKHHRAQTEWFVGGLRRTKL